MFEREDYTFIREDMHYCAGYAQSVSAIELPYGQPQFDNYAVAATYYRRAAEHALVLSTAEPDSGESVLLARDLLGAAATQYRNWGSPYALLLASIADDQSTIQEIERFFIDYLETYQSQIRRRPAKIVQYVYALIAGSNGPILSSNVSELLQPLRHHRIGILALSVNQLINVTQALERRERSISTAIAPILVAYDEALQVATQNKYHFKRLLMNFHPANIEVIGLLLRLYRQLGVETVELIETSPISGTAKVFLRQIIQNMERPGQLGINYRSYWDS